VTVKSVFAKQTIEYLYVLDAPIHFLSCEPLVEDIGLINFRGIDWVIVGVESGVQARLMKPEWVQSILDQATEQNVAFSSNNGGHGGSDGVKRNKKANGKALNGKFIQMMPQLTMK
jgi:protein gp37